MFLHIFNALIARGDSSDDDSQYGYDPSKPVALIFIVLFGISTALHLGQAVYFKMWWLFPTACLCGIGELVGWSGRLWSSFSPSADDPYMMQITTTIIAPTPLIAVSFILLGRIVERLGPCYSRITPRWYSRIFVSCDFIALCAQGAGGGLAATANNDAGAKLGANIMLGGIVFQFVAIIAYAGCAADFLRRWKADKPVREVPAYDREMRTAMDPRVKLLIWALTFSTFVLFIRSIYRIVELSTGWNGVVIQTQVYFNVFDGGMVVLALYTINIAHPGLLLRSPASAPKKPCPWFLSDFFRPFAALHIPVQ
ncbi:RTA1 like protein-domain-containing protein [Mycena rosella]|uniref:RTA1 like protein-domain-containing protein n=1 Tax=Mycena rosella TaxID=1033263 RepID=A0AAD7DJ06_MYCRO|nr:RTA1 like protein-domain-containing protein [Mycena rosella]